MDIKPDLIFTHLSFHTHIHPVPYVLQLFKEIKSKIDVKIVHSCNDARTHDRFMGDLRGSFDMALLGTIPLNNNCATSFKIPCFYMPYSSLTYDKMADPVPELAFNVPVFTGSPNAHRTGWADNRAEFIERLQKIMPLKIFKTQSGEDLRKRTPELSVSAKCILGLCVGYEIDGYIDVRPFQYLGTGAFMIMRKFMNMDRVIPDDLYVPFYDYNDPEAVRNLWNYWKDKDNSKRKIKAFNYIQQNHSSKIRLAHVLKLLNQI